MKQALIFKSIAVRFYIALKAAVRRFLMALFSVPVLNRFYYALVSSAFNSEHAKVIAGLRVFRKNDLVCENMYSLRRNVHRIEKGLVMRPRRELFAADYIVQTVGYYCNACESADVDGDLLRWAYDVLDSYFNFASGDPAIDDARRVFQGLRRVETVTDRWIPTPRATSPEIDVSIQDFLLLAKKRRSIRWYLEKVVSRDLLDQALLVASYSPSACNRQPFEFRVFDDPVLVDKVMAIPGGTTGWKDSPPVAVVLVGHLRAFAEERDRHLIYIDSSLAAMSFMFALETLGLSSCSINFPDIPEKNDEMERLLGLKGDEVVVMVISVGYADRDGLVPRSGKKSLDFFRSYNNANGH